MTAQSAINRDKKRRQERKSSCCENRFKQLFGFRLEDLSSWDQFVRLLSRPTDPASLGCVRFMYGLLMMLDIIQERGLAMADTRWGNKDECRFPLFDFLKRLPVEWMCITYLTMFVGAFGIMIGFFYHLSCMLFLLPYWYILFLDKSAWNNHSYLFGILGFLLLLSDANRYWSVDSFLKPTLHNSDVPLWNYTLLRTQVFLVYFLAGLKKLDVDWISGYSMENLAKHWVFDPFKLVMTDSQVDYVVVHLGGLTIDLLIGFLLFFDKTRIVGLLICSSFHLMNSQLFRIGMFPWMMIATLPLFCHVHWPRSLFRLVPRPMRVLTPDNHDDDTRPSSHCLYTKSQAKPENTSYSASSDQMMHWITPPTRPSLYHYAAAAFTVVFITWQIFLPYSHFITKGYNSWTDGLYGYSWDMMVHSRSLQHVRITYVDKDTGDKGYLNPEAWTKTWRWCSHPDMIQQYAQCIANHLQKHGMHNIELYFDVWISLNKRFQQRIVDPHVDMLSAKWNIFQPTPWVMPLLVDLSDWRAKLAEIEQSLHNSTQPVEVVFVADFPGLHLENYVHPDIGNSSLSVLQGKVLVQIIPDEDEDAVPVQTTTLLQGQQMQIPPGRFHNVHTISSEPSCYMYIYTNTTEVHFLQKLKEYELSLKESDADQVSEKFSRDPMLSQYQQMLADKESEERNEKLSVWETLISFLQLKYAMLIQSIQMCETAVLSIITKTPFEKKLQELRSDNNPRSPHM